MRPSHTKTANDKTISLPNRIDIRRTSHARFLCTPVIRNISVWKSHSGTYVFSRRTLNCALAPAIFPRYNLWKRELRSDTECEMPNVVVLKFFTTGLCLLTLHCRLGSWILNEIFADAYVNVWDTRQAYVCKSKLKLNLSFFLKSGWKHVD